jgi:hypothetical protein
VVADMDHEIQQSPSGLTALGNALLDQPINGNATPCYALP